MVMCLKSFYLPCLLNYFHGCQLIMPFTPREIFNTSFFGATSRPNDMCAVLASGIRGCNLRMMLLEDETCDNRIGN